MDKISKTFAELPEATKAEAPRRRGRPPKPKPLDPAPKRGRGRPRKPEKLGPCARRTAVRAEQGVTAAEQTRAIVQSRLYGPVLPGGELVTALIERVGATEKRLPHDIRRLIVELNACRRSPTETANFIREYTGFEVSVNECAYYDPTKRAGAGLKHEWRVLFETTRRGYDQQVQNLNCSQVAWRLDQLQHIYEAERDKPRPNPLLLLKIIEQMKGESNDHLKRKLADKETAASPLSDDEKMGLIVQKIAQVVARQERDGGDSPLRASLPESARRAIDFANGVGNGQTDGDGQTDGNVAAEVAEGTVEGEIVD